MKSILARLGIFFLGVLTWSCVKPELAVLPAYPEFNGLFKTAEETYQKLRIRYVGPGEDSSEPALLVLAEEELAGFVDAGLAMNLEDAFGVLEAGRPAGRPAGGPGEKPAAGGIEDIRRTLPLYYRDGRFWALFLNSGTGVLCYDPELAERYFHVSDPPLVQERLGDLNSFIVSAFLIGSRSLGSCALIPSADELLPAFQHTRSVSLQRAGLTKEEKERWFKDIVGLFRDRGWDGLKFENGGPRRTLAFFLGPGKTFSSPGGGANWRVIRGPDPESNGGLWLVLHRDIFTGKKRRVRHIQNYLKILLPALIPDNPTAAGTPG
ncbi:MAG: hypothetical protein LBE02_07105 [Spirochaetaceae bacterium]|jgi:hypothetical protein|nr:hypothetical protein [Spirochaetaceae bacterium]